MEPKNKQKFLPKLLALCLAAVLAMAMQLTAFAAGLTSGQKGSFTVTGLEEGVTVSAYPIITVNIDDESGQPENPMYTWNAAVAGWMKTNGYGDYVGEDNAVKDSFNTTQGNPEENEAKAAQISKFLEALTAAVKKGAPDGIALAPAKTANANAGGTAEFTEMAMGEYLLTAQGAGSVKIYQPTTVTLVPEYDKASGGWTLPEGSAGMKQQEPSISKEVKEPADKTVAVGDTVTYLLKPVVPSYPENATAVHFEIGDTMGAGLTYDKGSVKVYSDEGLQTEVPAQDNYTVTDSGDTLKGRTFRVAFTESFIKANGGNKIYVTYTAKVNEQAFAEDALGNTAYIGFNNDPYSGESYKEVPDEEEVFTYGIALTKVNDEGTALQGAEFELAKQSAPDTPLKFTGTNGVYTYAPGTEEPADLAVGTDGTLKLQGLDADTYILTETKAPEGYVLPNGSITIVIQDTPADGTIDEAADGNVKVDGSYELYPNTGKNVTITGNVISFQVENTSAEDAGFDLPKTGGIGTMLFTVGGILLMGGAVFLVVLISRKTRQDRG